MSTQVFRPRLWLGALAAASSIPISCGAFDPNLREPLLQFLVFGFGLLMLPCGIGLVGHRVVLAPTGITSYGCFGSQIKFTVNWDNVQSWAYHEKLPIEREHSEGGSKTLIWVSDPSIYFALTDGRVVAISKSMVSAACFRRMHEFIRLALADHERRVA